MLAPHSYKNYFLIRYYWWNLNYFNRATDYVIDDLLDNYAETNAIRLHFSMNGSVIVSRGGNRPKIPPLRRLELMDDEPLTKKASNATESNTLIHWNQDAQTSKILSFPPQIECLME